MEFRLATKNDFKTYLPTKKEFFYEYGISKKTDDFIRQEFIDYLNNGAIVIAIIDNKIIGYLSGRIEKCIYEISGYIGEVFVKKEFRGKGISNKLKDQFILFLKTKEIKICRIDVNPDNPAYNVYKNWGFTINKYRMTKKI